MAASYGLDGSYDKQNGQGPPPEDLRQGLVIVRECVSWLCKDALWEHEWVTEPNVLWKENEILEALNYALDVPCPLQWGLMWFFVLFTA